jgi:hypothetical protein
VPLKAPALEIHMSQDPVHTPAEPMVDARTAHQALCIPLQWLNDKAQRRARGIPAYRIGHLLRFRLSELERWRDRTATVIAPGQAQSPEADDGCV